MGEENAGRSCITVSCLIAILCVLMFRSILYSGESPRDYNKTDLTASSLAMYALFISTLLFCCVGVYGTHTAQRWGRTVVTVGWILCSLLLLRLICEIYGLAVRPQVRESVKKHFLDMLPLSNASRPFVESLQHVQNHMKCCGLYQGYEDWGYNISLTCLCVEGSTKPCVAAPTNSILYKQFPQRPILIYAEPCLQYFIENQMELLDTSLGIGLGVLLLLVLAAVLCIFILCYMRKEERRMQELIFNPRQKSSGGEELGIQNHDKGQDQGL